MKTLRKLYLEATIQDHVHTCLLSHQCTLWTITNGQRIDTNEALSIFNKKQFHHVYPKGHLKRMQVPEEENLLLNICMLAAAENNAVSDANPQSYLPQCIVTLKDSANSVFEPNLLPSPESFDYKTAIYDDFHNG